ncbi:MAG TPA: hypothetical protein VFX16_27105 [Pseudonocardiaceae bacterium]|nr:hypothetical protein [Pseudonocardiaceae bacterium]
MVDCNTCMVTSVLAREVRPWSLRVPPPVDRDEQCTIGAAIWPARWYTKG